jgi:hypothetical protein
MPGVAPRILIAETTMANEFNATPKSKALQDAIAYVVDEREELPVEDIGLLRLPRGSAEAQRCTEIRSMIDDYVARSDGSRPLSFAVFGPPGSGKSTFVRVIATSLLNGRELVEVNLSQFTEATDLAAVFESHPDPGVCQVFFFDEFDAPLDNAPLGWLRWFLAPMQDGKLSLGRTTVKIGKAVFFFAGGTAMSLDEFDRRARTDLDSYRARKVPDFVSRLRGSIDIGGLNSLDDERPVRRALVLRRLLDKRWQDRRDRHSRRLPIDPAVIETLLSGGHFVHGVRSMEALLESARYATDQPLIVLDLSNSANVEQHFSRGPLDRQVIGISAGLRDEDADKVLRGLPRELFQNGATLAYGGDLLKDGTLRRVVDAAKDAPRELRQREDKRIRNYAAFPAFHGEEARDQKAKGSDSVDFLELETLAGSEKRELGIPDDWFRALPNEGEPADAYVARRHVAWAISLFRMRVRMIHDVSALIVLGGKDDGQSWGRFAGIAEEVMLALALGKPVYILGGCGGAALAVGKLLGLEDTIVNVDHCLVPGNHVRFEQALKPYAHCFRVPGVPRTPFDLSELRAYLFDRAVTTDAWPWNGLDVDENRRLFSSAITTDAGARGAVSLIVQGLSRLDWKADATN